MIEVLIAHQNEPDLQFILTYNGYAKHLGVHRQYRKAMEWLFRKYPDRVYLVVPEKEHVEEIMFARNKRRLPCRFTTGMSQTARSSMILMKYGEVTHGAAFTHESEPRVLPVKYATDLWHDMQRVSPRVREKEPQL